MNHNKFQNNLEDFNWDAYENSETPLFTSTEDQPVKNEITLDSINANEVVKGTVTAINKREVIVKIGDKSEGVIPASEFRYNPDLKEGDEVEVYIDSPENRAGQLVLSHKKARATTSWARVNEALENQEIVTGFVKCRTKGGMIVDVFGIEAFLPGSQIDVKPIRDYDVFVNKTMEFKVLKINQESRNVVVSHKVLIEAEKEEKRKTLKKANIVKGTIQEIKPYGAFVDLGFSFSGMIHHSEVPCPYGEIDNVLSKGEEVDVFILDDTRRDKNGNQTFSLSLIKAQEIKKKGQVHEDIKNLNGEEKTIRDIWKIFTQINKCLLQYMKQPILLEQKTLRLIEKEHRLIAKLNTTSKLEMFKNAFKENFNTELIQRTSSSWNFYLNVDTIPEEKLKNFESECEYLYMKFFPEPYIEGRIFDYTKEDKKIIEDRIVEYFPNIVIISEGKGNIVFRQSYSEHNQFMEWRTTLNDVLVEMQLGGENENEETGEKEILNPISFKFEIYDSSSNLDRFLVEQNTFGQKEQETIVTSSLIGEIFSFEGIEIGKLIKVNYPYLIFSIPEESQNLVKKLIEEEKINQIYTDLTGESEKINRLQESFDFITENPDQLRNPKLASFLFDASKATPIKDDNIKKRVKIINQNRLNKSLNDSQVEAIAKAVEAEDLALVQGPPGTGKSTAIAELIWQLAYSDSRKRTLLTSEANLAVDNALDRFKYSSHNLVKPIRIGSGDKFSTEGLQYSITECMKWAGIVFDDDYILKEDDEAIINSDEYKAFNPKNVVLSRWMENIFKRNSIEDPFLRKEWFDYITNLPLKERSLVYKQYVNHCNVIGATCSSICEKNYLSIESGKRNIESKFFKRYKKIFPSETRILFDTVVQDEASKATPAELSLPLIYGKKSIIIGDHRQLPPNLDREDILYKLHYQSLQAHDVEEKENIIKLEKFVKDNFDQLEKSHFERLFIQADNSIKGTFHLQYRMHPAINHVIEQFYVHDGGLECGFKEENYECIDNPFSRYHGMEIDGFITPLTHVIWVDTRSPEIAQGTSRINVGEVKAIDWIMEQFSKSKDFENYNKLFNNPEDQEIGLITFYGGQLKYLKRLQTKYLGKINLKISSVDRFQGMERNIIIVSLVRSNCIAENISQSPDFRIYKELGFRKQKDFGFAKSPNRLNVALSRAKRLLIIVGNSEHYSSYVNKNGEAIYKNVYDSIQTPSGRIIKWDQTQLEKQPRVVAKNRSTNLNTRDISLETDIHLRNSVTLLNANRENPKIAVLELSTKAVKCLIGKDPGQIKNSDFNFNNFIRDTVKTETGKGLNSQNEMDMVYFKKNVLPYILNYKRLMIAEHVDIVYTVSTAAYRTARNRDEIIQLIKEKAGINVQILSKQEEANSTLYAYLFSTKYKTELINSSHVIMIDQGGGSTEISVFKDNKLIDSHSVNLGTTALRNVVFCDSERDTPIIEALKKSDHKIKERLYTLYKNMGEVLMSENESFCICVGTAITKAIGEKSSAQHDKILSKEKIQEYIIKYENEILNRFKVVGDLLDYDCDSSKGNKRVDNFITIRLGLPMFLELMNRYNINQIHVSGTGLWYGIYLKHLYQIED